MGDNNGESASRDKGAVVWLVTNARAARPDGSPESAANPGTLY